jgi:hypothetical protein
MTEMRRTLKITAAVLACAGMLATSTIAAAAAPAATAPAAQTQAPDAWMMLSAMSSTRAVALGGATAAAQPNDNPPPPPPPPPPYAGGPVINGEVIGILVWFALIAMALGISGGSGRPNSPA